MAMTEEDKKKKKKKENKDQILLALAILLGGLSRAQISEADAFSDVPEQAQKTAIAEFAKNKDLLQPLVDSEKLSQVEVQQSMAEIGRARGSKVFVIENPGDGRTCDRCKVWIGKRVSDSDPSYPSVDDWMRSGGLHYGCRCSLHEVQEADLADKKAADYLQRKQKRIAEQIQWQSAYNATPLNDLVFN